MSAETGWSYLSFADDEKFRGGVIIQCDNPIMASMLTHVLGINPGGEMLMVAIPGDKVPDEKWRNRLLSKADVIEMWPAVAGSAT